MKDSDKAELLDCGGNVSVVRIPHRRHPGIAIQGDTFYSLVCDIRELLVAARSGAPVEAVEEGLAYLADTVESYRRYFEEVLRARGMTLPYVSSDS